MTEILSDYVGLLVFGVTFILLVILGLYLRDKVNSTINSAMDRAHIKTHASPALGELVEMGELQDVPDGEVIKKILGWRKIAAVDKTVKKAVHDGTIYLTDIAIDMPENFDAFTYLTAIAIPVGLLTTLCFLERLRQERSESPPFGHQSSGIGLQKSISLSDPDH